MLPNNDYPRTNKHAGFSGSTNAAGVWAVIFDQPFQSTPHVSVELIGADEHTNFRVLSVTTIGFSVHVFRRTVVNLLGIELPSFTVQNVAGQVCSAVATEIY